MSGRSAPLGLESEFPHDHRKAHEISGLFTRPAHGLAGRTSFTAMEASFFPVTRWSIHYWNPPQPNTAAAYIRCRLLHFFSPSTTARRRFSQASSRPAIPSRARRAALSLVDSPKIDEEIDMTILFWKNLDRPKGGHRWAKAQSLRPSAWSQPRKIGPRLSGISPMRRSHSAVGFLERRRQLLPWFKLRLRNGFNLSPRVTT